MANLSDVIKDSFIQFSGAVLQSRALVDVRDCIKPSARQIFYCMKTGGFIHSKPYQKTLKSIGECFRLYIHGDSSAEGVIMRAGQPFAYRYPLIEIEGSYGTLLASESWAAPRYTGARLSALAEYLFTDIDKNTIEEWRDNYDNTEKYPTVLPSKGFYNIVNGSYGIGVGASASIPQYNLKELNTSLIKLLNNPDISFDEIYCHPDFATGGILLNAAEVKESHKFGNGKACKLRSVIDYNKNERCLIVTEIPYMVYTETICKELEEIINSEENPGIDRFNDLTGAKPLIKIYLSKNANVDKVIKYLYKNTSLVSYYSINFTMLDDGRFPKVFTWKELLQSHLDHEIIVYTRGYEYDINKLKAREHILDGLLICLANIENVVQTIKKSTSTSIAKSNLIKEYLLDEEQATAVLKLTLSKLAHLEVEKIKKEKTEIVEEITRLTAILADKKLLYKEIENGLREVANKYGDARRTIITNIEKDDEEAVDIRKLSISITNMNRLIVSEYSSLYTQKRGGIGNRIKMDTKEYIASSCNANSNDEIMFFTNKGNVYHCKASSFTNDLSIYINSIIPIQDEEKIQAITPISKENNAKYILFITRNGLIKKSELTEYNPNRTAALRALTLTDNDEIISVLFTNSDKAGILTEQGNFVIITTDDIRPIKRIAQGIKAIKLNDEDYVISAHLISDNTKNLVSISGNGFIKSTPLNEFTIQGKNTKGSKLQKLNACDWMADFLPMDQSTDITIVSTQAQIKIKFDEIPQLGRGTIGNKAIKLSDKSNVTQLLI